MTPQGPTLVPGIERHQFPFTWEALDNYIRNLQSFREEHGPKPE
jgi:hypothetical protein